ncbi:unnamed protein product [Sphagnum balticum]
MLQWPQPLPLEDECAWLLREVGTGLLQWFNGQAVNLVAKGSAVTQQELLTQHFPGFQDHCVYKGHRVFLYERAQIFVADVWSAFKGVDLGEFKDIASITIFADHVVPAVLQHWGTLTCSPTLATVLDTSQEITPGSEEEVEIRTCSITAVEWLQEYLTAQFGKQRFAVEEFPAHELSLKVS